MCGIVVHIASAFRLRAPLVIAAALLIGVHPTPARAQTPAPVPTPARGLTVSAGVETHRDRLHYGFENPSNIDTAFLVPHRFDQTYVADNRWFVVSARYPLLGEFMQTEFSLTPWRATFASDLDTFFDPNGDVVVS